MIRTSQDGFDMVKLQKNIKRQQRASLNARNTVSKLSPSEIRDLNNAALATKNARMPSLRRTSPMSPIRRSPSITPPLTPEEMEIHQAILVQRPRPDLPTPPISPDNERRDLSFGNHAFLQQQTPRPQPYDQSGLSSTEPSRQPSNASSYRGVTSRNPDLSNEEPISALPGSTQQIVANPLSNFSRPRRSPNPPSPDRFGRDQRSALQRSASYKSEASQSKTTDNLPTYSVAPSQPPLQNSNWNDDSDDDDERVGRQTLQPPALRVRKKRSRSMPALLRDRSPSIADTPLRVVEKKTLADSSFAQFTALPQGLEGLPVQNRAVTESPPPPLQEASQKKTWRKNTNYAPSTDRGKPSARPEQKSRFTLSRPNDSLISISYSDTVAGDRPLMKDSLKKDLPSNQNSVFQSQQKAEALKGDFRQHPAVRPHTANSDARSIISLPANVFKDGDKLEDEEIKEEKEEIKENLNPNLYPTYTRCSCCGKLRKPAGFTSNLSPVLENEHLRTNFSFELGRTSMESHCRRPGSRGQGSRMKHIPIIPMEINNQMRQATIEPFREIQPSAEPVIHEDPQTSVQAIVQESQPLAEDKSAVNQNIPSRPGSRASEVRPPSRSGITTPRVKEELKVVRFANMYQRKKEMELRAKEQKPKAGQEQMHTMSQLDSLYPTTEEKITKITPKQSPDEPRTHIINAVMSVPAVAAPSEIEPVNRMPTPPSSTNSRNSFRDVPNTPAAPIIAEPQDDPNDTKEDTKINTDLSSVDGSSYDPKYEPVEEAVTSIKPIETQTTEQPKAEAAEEVDEYEEIARSSPFSEEPSTPVPSSYPYSNYVSNSSDEALPLPPPSGPNGRNKVVVRMIRTPSVPARSPKRPQTACSNQEPTRIGDWVLPIAATKQKPPTSFASYQSYATMKFDGLVATHEMPTPFSASSSRDNSFTAEEPNLSSNSSFSILQVQEAKSAQVKQVTSGGSIRVKEVGSSIARKMRAAQRRMSVKA